MYKESDGEIEMSVLLPIQEKRALDMSPNWLLNTTLVNGREMPAYL